MKHIQSIGRIVLIDDDAITNMCNQLLIRKVAPAAEVITYTSAEEALQQIQPAEQATLVLLDLNMPGIDGWDFLDAFAGWPEALRDMFIIYILSSSPDAADINRGIAHPHVADYLVKPLGFETISRILQLQPARTEPDAGQPAA